MFDSGSIWGPCPKVLRACIPVLLLLTTVWPQQTESNEIWFIATDKNGMFVDGLTSDDLLFELNGKPLTNFSLEKKTAPAAYVLAVDNSGSLRTVMKPLFDTAATIYRPNPNRNLTLLMRFVSRDKIQIGKQFTDDPVQLDATLNGFFIEGGQTALLDAVHSAVSIVAKQKLDEGFRRSVVVISDGEDRESVVTSDVLRDLVLSEGVQLFFLGVVLPSYESPSSFGQPIGPKRKDMRKFFEELSRQSGGRSVFVKDKELLAAAHNIRGLLNERYVIRPKDPLPVGGTGERIALKLRESSSRGKVQISLAETRKSASK